MLSPLRNGPRRLISGSPYRSLSLVWLLHMLLSRYFALPQPATMHRPVTVT